MEDLISVLVASYNVGKYLRFCLDSIVTQTYKNLDIICIDDESVDDSWDIIKEYQEKDSRITALQISHSGLPSVRRTGLKLSKGDFIVFIDGDDVISYKYIEYLSMCYDKGAELACCNHKIIREDENPQIFQEVSDSKILKVDKVYKDRNYNHHIWGKLYRKSVLRFHRGKNEDLQDGIIDLFALEKSWNKVYKIENSLYYYRKRDFSESMKNPSLRFYNTVNSIYNIVSKNKDYSIMAFYGFKLALRYRWEASVKKEKAVVKSINIKARYLLSRILFSNVIAFTDKLQCCIFFISGTLYRFIRVKTDPSMRIVEQSWKVDGV